MERMIQRRMQRKLNKRRKQIAWQINSQSSDLRSTGSKPLTLSHSRRKHALLSSAFMPLCRFAVVPIRYHGCFCVSFFLLTTYFWSHGLMAPHSPETSRKKIRNSVLKKRELVFLNVYHLTGLNKCLCCCGLSMYHSSIEVILP